VRSIGKLSCMIVIMCAFLAVPAMAGTVYLTGSPNLSAYIAGTNEFSQGNEVQLTIIVENNGLNELEFVQPGTVTRDDLPTTAKSVMAALNAGDSPVVIKSDPQMLGDIKSGSNASAVYTTKINSHASGGSYMLPLAINYSYLSHADQYGVDTIQYTYTPVSQSIGIPIKIKSDVSIDVLSALPEHLNVGSEGYIDLSIKNTGSDDGKKAIVKILPNVNSSIIPTDNSVYIGDFPSGSMVKARYKVAISTNAERQSYPVDVVVVYENSEGDVVTSRTSTIGIPVGAKVDFAVVSPPAEMNPGDKKVINVEYKNIGETKVYSARGRINPVDPFTSVDDIAYLGDIEPGESAVASYEVIVDRSATIKEYGLDAEIRYMDALDTTYVSDVLKVQINVNSPTGINALLSNPGYILIIVVGIIGIAFLVRNFRKK
jgi:hypothetical protein